MINKAQTGVGMIEVMVSLLLLVLSVLGFVGFQARSMQATSESLVRTNALTIMRDLGDKVRFNISARETYENQINNYDTRFNGGSGLTGTVSPSPSPSPSAPGKDCGLTGSTVKLSDPDTVCSPDEQAAIDAFLATKNAYENGFRLRMTDCPGSQTVGIMQTRCLIVAWNRTLATLGNDSDPDDANKTMDCMTTTGNYHGQSECMLMELL